MVAAYAASVVLFYVFARYRLPLVPFLMMFAGNAIVFGASFAIAYRTGTRHRISIWKLRVLCASLR